MSEVWVGAGSELRLRGRDGGPLVLPPVRANRLC
jgi:hypothetical protein